MDGSAMVTALLQEREENGKKIADLAQDMFPDLTSYEMDVLITRAEQLWEHMARQREIIRSRHRNPSRHT